MTDLPVRWWEGGDGGFLRNGGILIMGDDFEMEGPLSDTSLQTVNLT